MTRQHQLMLGSLVLLVVALGMLLYHDRDFWFPDTFDSEDLGGPATVSASSGTAAAGTPHASRHSATKATKDSAPQIALDSSADLPPVTAVRTVLPPLQVEVVAGDVHHTLRPGTNSVHVDMQPGGEPQTLVDLPPPPTPTAETAAALTSNAAENVQLSPSTSEVVTHSVAPSYPLLARQTKVQGSVILQAVINRDGTIQDLHIVSGSPILAGAAREAVRQWHFKPHYQGTEPVETVAKITVNFQISTN
jgi:TonB family protein